MRIQRVQIAGVSTIESALRLEELGADALGFTLRLPTGPHDGLTEERARDIIAQLPPFITPCLITYVDTAGEAVPFIKDMGVTAVQFHGDIAFEELQRVKSALPYVKIIKGINVIDESAIGVAKRFEPFIDAIILDTYDPVTKQHGATGKTHDWSISARLVSAVEVPVILAGGLNPDNVSEAIRQVKPWGVDVHTGIENPDGTMNFEKARAFIEHVKAALF